MRDPAGPPTWLLIAVGLLWAFALGVWRERHRPGGSLDLHDEIDLLEANNDDLLQAVDELTAQHARARIEVDTRRLAAMHAHPSAADPRDLHVIRGGRR